MATLIICPACGTRYETAAVFPPEGRKVRCSKCTHVWQALPVTAEPGLAAMPTEAAVAAVRPQSPPPAPPQAAPTVNTGMRGFAGIAQAPPAEASSSVTDSDADFGSEEDLAAQAAYFNDETAASAEAPAPAAEKSGGIFARLARRSPAPSAPPAPPAPSIDAGLADADISEADKEAARAEAAMLQAAFGGDAAALGGTADLDLPGERPKRKKPSVVTIGWAVLGLIVALVIGTLVFAPSAVVSVLPGAARLYGTPVGSGGLAFESVRYGWTSEGGQTVLEVQGDVVNTTSASVGVPTVVIALRDESGEEISEWTTQVGEAELAAGQHAPFLRQIPSPPSNVRSVKVRFAKAE